MNILFLGGAGFIGANLINKFTKIRSNKLFVYELPSANLSRLDDFKADLFILRGQLKDKDLLKSIIISQEIDIVIHLVSTLIPSSSHNECQKEFQNVILPTLDLLDICSKLNTKFVFFSSGGAIYGNNTKGIIEESDCAAPISYYGLSKQIIEDSILLKNRMEQLKYLIVRPSNPFGIGQSLNGAQGFIAVAIGNILSGQPIHVWGDGNNIRDYIYINDLADSFFNLITSGVENEVFNIGSGDGHSINEVIRVLENIVCQKIEVIYTNQRSIDVKEIILSTSKLSSFINVKKTHFEDGVRQFFFQASNEMKI